MKHCQLTPGRISAYEKHLRREERAPATVTKYLRAVRELAAFLDGRPVTKESGRSGCCRRVCLRRR